MGGFVLDIERWKYICFLQNKLEKVLINIMKDEAELDKKKVERLLKSINRYQILKTDRLSENRVKSQLFHKIKLKNKEAFVINEIKKDTIDVIESVEKFENKNFGKIRVEGLKRDQNKLRRFYLKDSLKFYVKE